MTPASFQQNAVEWIKKTMAAQPSLSIRQFGALAKMDPTNISRIVRGKRMIQKHTLERMVAALPKKSQSRHDGEELLKGSDPFNGETKTTVRRKAKKKVRRQAKRRKLSKGKRRKARK